MEDLMEDLKDRSIEWLEGYLSACYNFAVWQDGELLLGLGCGVTKYKDIKAQIEKIIREKVKS